ncbi:MAG: hypothetical protein HRT44_08730 [Bdellovibrionales bacterium]|nr:hypothetical protein [Bdellovibrionales bacterium]
MKQDLYYLRRSISSGKPMLSHNLENNTENSPVSSGWLWTKALQFSQNDPNLAMSLIGLCGHDDTGQLPMKLETCSGEPCMSFEGIPFANEKQKATYLPMLDELQSLYETVLTKDGSHLQDGLTDFFDMFKRSNGVVCPMAGSTMYLEGALGKETMIPEALRKQIESIQAPTMGATALPSKYYHTLGAAYATCSLARGGVPGFMVRKIQSVGINSYRMIRLCQKITHRSSYSGNTLLSRDDVESYTFSEATKIRANPNLCPPIENPDYTGEISDVCRLGIVSSGFFDPDLDDETLRRRIRNIVTEIDASELFVKEVVGASNCEGVQLTDSNVGKLSSASNRTRCQQSKISQQRCDRARNKLKTWWIDFKWSEAQHMAGASFSSNHCKPATNYFNRDLEKSSCAAIKSLNDNREDTEIQEATP